MIQTYAWAIIALPIIGFLINGIGHKKIAGKIGGLIGTLMTLGSFVSAILLFKNFKGNTEKIKLFDWINAGSVRIPFSFQIDQLSLIMLLVITGVGTLIHVYSLGYMGHDKGQTKFFAFLNLFIFSMLVLVLGSNFLVMFIGWEGVGLCSYLLIGFWNKNSNYADAARKAFIMNRIGDLGFLIGIFLIYIHFGTLEYTAVFESPLVKTLGVGILTSITLCLFVGAMGKSAQVPLFTWLPDAMAGPTPVSALIHAATMVTAGIYMVVRANVLFSASPLTLQVVSIVGILTALIGASIGLFQNDIKKVLAYSTVSQLGYMFVGLGVMAYDAAMFHVITHAFFKALLFLGAGSVIHAMSSEQDIRSMGGLKKHIPITFWTFLLGTIAIAGIPPFAGFFSKDEILLHAFEHNKVLWVLGLLGSAMTSFYMFRLVFLTFFGSFRGTQSQASHLHESPLSMTIPLMLLAVLSVFGGWLNVPAVLHGGSVLTHFLSPIIKSSGHEAAVSHGTELMLMGLSTVIALISMGAAYLTYVSKGTLAMADGSHKGFVKLVYDKYKIDEIYQEAFVEPLKTLSENLAAKFEPRVIQGIGGNFEWLTNRASGLLSKLQTGKTGTYLLFMVLGILAIFINSFGKEIFDGFKSIIGLVDANATN